MLEYLIFAGVTVTFLIGLLIYLYPGSKPKSTIPGPDPSDIQEGNLPDVMRAGSLFEYLLQLHSEYGTISGFYWGEQFVVSVADPKYFEQQIGVFDKPSDLLQMFAPLIKGSASQLQNGPAGRKKQQQLCDFAGEAFIRSSREEFLKVGNDLVKRWRALTHSDHVPVSEFMNAFAFKVLARFCFGSAVTDREIHALKQHYDVVWNELESGLLSASPHPRSEALDNAYTKLRAAVIKLTEKPASKDGGVLLQIRRDGRSPETAAEEAIGVLTAGYRPLASWLCWSLYYLACHPEVQERAREEVLAKEKSQNFADLCFLRDVLNESLRCACVVPFSSRVQSFDTQLGEHLIPKETPVIQAFGVVFRDKNFFEEPERFRPQRFSDLSSEFAFAPFGFAGKRQCPAEKLSRSIAAGLVAQILSSLRIHLVGEELSCPVAYGLVTRPAEEVWIGVRSLED